MRMCFTCWTPDKTSVLTLIVRTRGGDASNFAGKVRSILGTLDPTARITPRPMLELYRQMDLAVRIVTLVIGLITLSVLLLSAAGIYALMSFTVSQRKKRDWHSRRDGRRCEATADQHLLEGGGPARRRRRGRHRIRRGARPGQQRRGARHRGPHRATGHRDHDGGRSDYSPLLDRPGEGCACSLRKPFAISSSPPSPQTGFGEAGFPTSLRSLSLTTTNIFV